MLGVGKILLATAALSLSISPALASAANPASKLSIAPASARAHAKTGKSRLGGTTILGLALLAVAVGAVVIINNPDSP
ncbi:hypothetical protein BH09PSE4_BH09PSE4_20900 [soil metagenome]